MTAARRVLLTGGGTGGHITPALATADAIRELRPDVEVEFVGTERGLESRLVPAAGYLLHTVRARPIRRSASPSNLAVPAVIARAAWTARRLIKERNVAVTCVFGGYTSGPLAVGARMAKVPLVLHEQNAVPGLANRIAARWAGTVAVSVPGVEDAFPHPDRVEFTGNPVRADLIGIDREQLRGQAASTFGLDPDRRTLLVFGGSLGAKAINDAVLSAVDRWGEPERLQVLHAAGARDHQRVASSWAQRDTDRLRVRCVEFIERMELAYAIADVVLCRAGASTIAEVTACGLPSILVPYPHALADEQTANGRALHEAGAAVLVPDAELDAERLVAEAEPILTDEARLTRMSEAARALGRPHAAQAVARLVLAAGGLDASSVSGFPGSGGPFGDDGALR